MTVIAHISDTHGTFPHYRSDAVAMLHTGDFQPNGSLTDTYIKGLFEQERQFQEVWINTNKDNLMKWIGDRYFVYCAGNHDYYDPIPQMIEWGIKAINVTNKEIFLFDKRIYGFPYIPWIRGVWNYEAVYRKMKDLADTIPFGLDILMAHCPPYNVLDWCKETYQHEGNTALATWLSYHAGDVPKYLLCGHIHDANGFSVLNIDGESIIVSNAATTVHHIEM